MTPDTAIADPQIPINQPPSTAGMTTKVVKGSLWTLAGHVAPLGVSLVTTPFTIRLLGAEGYGVLILVGLIPTYFGFADFGMSMAATKFGSQAYAEGDAEKEGRVVRTAALIAFAASLPIGLAIFLFSRQITGLFNVPEHFDADASVALKIAAVTFVVGFLSNIFKSPQLARLRMDLNTFITSGFRIAALVATPIVIYLGFSIIGAVSVLLAANLLTLAGHIYISGRLVPQLFQTSIDRTLFRPLLRFGGGLVISGVAAVLLVNIEKLILTRMSSVETLAHYSVAFILASMAGLFSGAMLQSLIPAFSQLLAPDKREQMDNLFSRALRANLICMLPVMTFLFVIARPLFTILFGEEFGRESTLPFYILLAGLFFNILAYVPMSVIMASGRSDLLAKVYWAELFPYIGLIALLTMRFGAAGAAAAWSIRVIVDAALLAWLSRKYAGASFHIFKDMIGTLSMGILLLLPSIIAAAISLDFPNWSFLILIFSLSLYSLFAWKKLLGQDERLWLIGKLPRAVYKHL